VKDFFLFSKQPSKQKEAWLRSCIQHNESSLIRYVKTLVRDLEVSKDIVQESFLKLWQQDHIKMLGHERQWLFTTSRNRAYDFLRSRHSKAYSVENCALEVADPAPNAEEQLLNISTEALLAQLLKKLTPAQQEVVNLKFQEGLSYKEISAITGLSVNHVGVLIHNIVTNLKESLKKAESKGGR
jgi:RNA polymerase sigma-70 factor (ECF subfamily)